MPWEERGFGLTASVRRKYGNERRAVLEAALMAMKGGEQCD